MAKRTVKEQLERAAFWKRKCWPCVVLSVDSGATAGGTILLPAEDMVRMEDGPFIHRTAEIDSSTRDLENFIEEAVCVAREVKLPLVLVSETWNSGGRLGIDAWMGLGAEAGHWKRAFLLAAREGCDDVINVSRPVLRIPQVRWRSWMMETHGVYEPDPKKPGEKKYRPFNTDEWKRAATRTCSEMFPELKLNGANEAESVLMGVFAMRSDELGRLLPSKLLQEYGVPPPPPAPEKKKKRR